MDESEGDSGRPRKRQKIEASVPQDDGQDLLTSSCSDDITHIPLIPADRPTELVIAYDGSHNVSETELTTKLHNWDPDEAIFRRQFTAARHALSDAGSCASDLVWRSAARDLDISGILEANGGLSDAETTTLAKMKVHEIVKNWAFSLPCLDRTSQGFNVTPKFAKLVDILKSFQPLGDAFRGVVLVRRRATAIVLSDLLKQLVDELRFLRPQVVVEHGPFGNPEYQVCCRDALAAFGAGRHNLLIITKSVEDLVMDTVSVLVRFDLFDSQLSYAFSRASTRGHASHLLHMVERGNEVHRHILSRVAQLGEAPNPWIDAAGTPQGATPPSTLHETSDRYLSDSDDEDNSEEYLQDPATSARIYPRDAPVALYRFLAHKAVGAPGSPLFTYDKDSSSLRPYVCSLSLPTDGNLKKTAGEPSYHEGEARRSAAYTACAKLFRLGLLDSHAFPRPPLRIENVDSVNPQRKDKNGSNGTSRYPRKSANFWDYSLSVPLKVLYPTIVHPVQADERHGPIMLLTRLPLPDLPNTKVFYNGIPTTITFTKGAPLELDEEQFENVYAYTLRTCRTVMNKPFTCPFDKIPYFFAPLKPTWSTSPQSPDDPLSLPNVAEHIPWDLVTLAAQAFVIPLPDPSTITDGDIVDTIIQDRWVEFTKRFDAQAIRTDLNPMSKPEPGSLQEPYGNYVECCKARRKCFEGLKNYDQPLIQVFPIPPVLNRLNPSSAAAELKSSSRYLIPELCAKFTIPASTFRTALILPSITRRIDDILLVKEINAKFFDNCIKETHLHAALTAPSAGFEFDYERLELLGDSYLKYISSMYLFVTHPQHKEGSLHALRQRIISNKSLQEDAERAGIPPFIQSKPFVCKLWQPTNFEILPTGPSTKEKEPSAEAVPPPPPPPTTSGTPALGLFSGPADPTKDLENQPQNPSKKPSKRSRKDRQQEDQNFQWLGDKSIADVAEAIIGAAYVSGGREVALKVTKALHVPILEIDTWEDLGRKALAPPPSATAKLRSRSIESVESIIGHKFEHPHLLAQALTHTSVHGFEMTSYERLEFIGDAILDFMVIRHLFDREANLSPGALTLLKGTMVSNSTLAAVCVWSGLYQHLHFESPELARSIRAYATLIKEKESEEYRLAEEEGRSPGQYWTHVEPPKAISDVLESIIGAVYVSDNFTPVGAETLFRNVLQPFFDKHITLKTLSHHPTKILFELFQAHGCQKFEMVKKSDFPLRRFVYATVIVHDVVLAGCVSTTVQAVTRLVCAWAIDALEGDPAFMSRTCNCRLQSAARRAVKKALKQFWDEAGNDDEEIGEVESVLQSK
ncbi:hypothetical protein JAAARDRAFT_684703 [Jaapia argillacea MUCL 33604]|uniref:RNase III domain-containing protein n=1 Tax=Jaapia argillacea MUCL 33604 TaxID=933084 RepID=A0A067QQC3_9AGAM|nr:hypothetical protein JAAARDRAFT_684703 [Jaapia argillacea MUCL 33604]